MISFLFAMDKNWLIGKDNKLPWHLPNDLKYFKETTMNKKIVMGRKTFESIGRPLPGRETIVLTKNEKFSCEGCLVFHSINEFLQFAQNNKEEEMFVIGGAKIFEALLPFADRLYVTEIEGEFEGDTYFPKIDFSEWKLISQKDGVVDEKNVYPHRFLVYERDRKSVV